MSVVRRFAVAGLEQAARRSGRRGGLVVGALDETGQEKQGEGTAGVKRHYIGCAGRAANGINTVHLSYVRENTGHALAGVRQRTPAEHIDNVVKSLVMGLPLDLSFRTKGQLAVDISADAFADGLIFFDSSAATRCTATALSCGGSSKAAGRGMCCGSRRTSGLPSRLGMPVGRPRGLTPPSIPGG